MENVKRWRVCDLEVASILLYFGYPVTSFGRDGPRAFFEFAESESARTTVLKYMNKQLLVEPVKMRETRNHARDMVEVAMKS